MTGLLTFYGRTASRCGVSTVRFTSYWLLAVTVLATTLAVRNAAVRDPGSLFFNPRVGYAPKYSKIRLRQAQRFIEQADSIPPYVKSSKAAGLCVGIPSIAREGARYLRDTVGSLLAGLSPEERAGIYLIVFLPHTDPAIHPAYHEAWLHNVVDEVLLYNLTQSGIDYVRELERDDIEHRTKGLYDYTYLMKACYSTGAPYLALIEDDVIAMDGWYHRTVDGIGQAEAKSASIRGIPDFLYLRLFYTEEYLGWNSENWPSYSFWSVTVILSSALLLYWIRKMRSNWRLVFTPSLSLAIALIVVPWAVLLFFAAGKVTVFPQPLGVNQMNNFGCCAQGLVYPSHKAHDLMEWYQQLQIGFADMLTEQYGDEYNELRWALTPSVLQHIGVKSSKPDDYGHGAKFSMPVSQTIWNFAFESFSPALLRKEHELATLEPKTIRSHRKSN